MEALSCVGNECIALIGRLNCRQQLWIMLKMGLVCREWVDFKKVVKFAFALKNPGTTIFTFYIRFHQTNGKNILINI